MVGAKRRDGMLWLLGLVAAFCLIPMLAWGQSYPSLSQAPSMERAGAGDVAVIVAVERYDHLPPVRGAVANANDWETYFRRGLGMQEVHVVVNEDATLEEMARIAEVAAEDVGEGGRLWFVFIGHGISNEGGTDGLLVGADARQTSRSLYARGMAQQDLIEILDGGEQAETVLVLDACFSGRDPGGEALVETLAVVPVDTIPQIRSSSRTVLLSAAQSNEFAGFMPGMERPAFSYLLLGALRGWAASPTGEVRAEDAVAFARQSLRGLPGRVNQTPSVFGETGLVLARGVREEDPGIRAVMEGYLRGQGERAFGDGDPIQSDGDDCLEGMERNADTAGECCWPGQVYLNDRCVGLPTSCPAGRMVNESVQACVVRPCEGGRVRASDGVNCCWEGQGWSSARGQCVGVPTSCPGSMVVSGEMCIDEASISIAPGFTPDQGRATGTAGGNVSASTLGGGCVGQIHTSANHMINLEGNFSFLRFRVYADDDTTLVIRGPNGQLYCDDDSVGLDPVVEGNFAAGQYELFVGTYGGGNPSYTLEVTELRTGGGGGGGNFESLSIAPGFTPDPASVTGTAGGNVSASTLGGGCVGQIATNPDHMINLQGNFSFLRFRVYAGQDTTLVIRGPNGQLYCNDDTVGLDPVVEGDFEAGQYELFVGTYGEGNPRYTLEVTELRSNSMGANPGQASTGGGGGGGNFESLSIAPGFLPDPATASGTAGGTRDASTYGSTTNGPCRGQIATTPDHIVTLESSFSFLRFSASSSGDTSLVIIGPDNRVRCNDDTNGLDPSVEGSFPAGEYQVFVGDLNGDYPSYNLSVTEIR